MIFGKDKKARPSAKAHDYYQQARQALTADMKGAAVMYCAKAVQAEPDHAEYVQTFAGAIKGMAIKVFDPDLKEAVTIALASPHADPQIFAEMWYRLLLLDPGFHRVMELAAHKDYATFKSAFAGLAAGPSLADPLFLAGLRRLVLPSIVLERFLTHLRRALAEDGNGLADEDVTALAAALGHYCFYTGYIFELTGGEEESIAALRTRIDQAGNLSSCRKDIALLSCYEPLHAHPRAADIRDAFTGDAVLGPLAQELIAEPLAEKTIAAAIPRLTPIDDRTSRDVQLQYIEFPYPRWRFTEQDKKLSSYFEPLRDKELDILIAGCGTGQEAMYYSAAFPKARILAVDLSPASLSYAIRKAGERGAANIEFAQADILALPDALAGRSFDIVISSGVLHHMKEPEKGFTVVHSRLKPGGLMRISLYSALGRRHIIKGHQAIAAQGYTGTAQDMRRFRRDAARLLAPEDLAGIMRARDYFIMPQCRDLLFHVMEHQFDIGRIERLLNAHQCEFLEFVLPDAVLQQYRDAHPADPQGRTLAYWAAFETAHPDTFAAMYRFVARKKS